MCRVGRKIVGEGKGRVVAVGWQGPEAVFVDAWEDLVSHVETELAEFALFDEQSVLALTFPGSGAYAIAAGLLFWGEVVWVVGVVCGACGRG